MSPLHLTAWFLPLSIVSSSQVPPGVDLSSCPHYPYCGVSDKLVQTLFQALPQITEGPAARSGLGAYETNELNLTEHNFDPQQSAGSRHVDDPNCWFEDFYCWPHGPEEIEEIKGINTAIECQARCKARGDCQYFTFKKVRGDARCSLLRGCSEKEPRCPHKESCSSGPSQCSCSRLVKVPVDTRHTSYARWSCKTRDGLVINPYEKDIALTATCSATCNHLPPLHNPVTIESSCLLGNEWSTTAIAEGVVLDEKYPNYYWPQPNEPDLVCGCSPIILSYDPNWEQGASFTCKTRDQRAVLQAIIPGVGAKIDTGDECELECNGRVEAVVSCDSGLWSGRPDLGFYCYDDTKVKEAAEELAEKNQAVIKEVVELISSRVKSLVQHDALNIDQALGLMVEREVRKKMGDKPIYVIITEVLKQLGPILKKELEEAADDSQKEGIEEADAYSQKE